MIGMPLTSKATAVITAAALLRLAVFFFFPQIPDFLTGQVEVSTPISSYKRLQEGLYLYNHGVSPYDGGVFHQAPLLLVIFGMIPAPLIFVGIDTLNALALKTIAEHAPIKSSRFKPLDGTVIAAAYLFNPFTITSCLGRSTSTVTNAAIVHAVFNAVIGNDFRAMLAIAFATYLSVYPFLVLAPIVLVCWDKVTAVSKSSRSFLLYCVRMAWYYCGGIAIFLVTTPLILRGSWTFVGATYGVQITVPDLTPNVGLWWYFFIEMFDAFRSFFIGVFWLHLFSYTGGLTHRLRGQPLFVITCILGLLAIFKPYPTISDVSLYLGFLPLYHHILPCEFSMLARSDAF